MLLFVVVFVLAKLEFFYLDEYFEDEACDTMASCLWMTLQLALTLEFEGTVKSHHPIRVWSAISNCEFTKQWHRPNSVIYRLRLFVFASSIGVA